MKSRQDSTWLTVLGVAGLWILCPAEARADAINMEFVVVAGLVILIPLVAFEVFVEAAVLGIGLKAPYRQTLLVALAANLLSLAAGIPVKIFNAWMYPTILPDELGPYFRQYPRAAILGAAIYFVVTLLVEFLVVVGWWRRRAGGVRLRRVALTVLLANTATYALLAPLHYVATKPTSDIRQFTEDARWAQRPVTRFVYVDRDTGNLCAINTDGQGREVLVPDTVKDYQYQPEHGWFLYRNGSDHLCLLRRGRKSQVCWQTDQRFMMNQVACSPEGTIVAYLDRIGDVNPYELVLYDVDSGRAIRTGIKTHEDEYDPEIAWSNVPTVLFLEQRGAIEALQIRKDLSVAATELEPVDTNLLVVYGRFGRGHWWGGDDWGTSFSHDVADDKEAMTYAGLESHLSVKMGDSSFVLADNPGLLHLPSRGFGDVCFLNHGNELVFDDYRDIYLLDVTQRQVGWITHGSKAILPTARYQRTFGDAKPSVP